MKSRRAAVVILGSALAAGTLSRSGLAQGSPPPPPGAGGPDTMYFAAGGGRVGFIGMMEMSDKVVTGAPYSAQAATETVQTLSDGNQITRTHTAQIYRDSQGRTRREHTLTMVGPFSASGAPHAMITINDPVAGVRYMLDPQDKTATKMPPPPKGQEMGRLKKRLNAELQGSAEGQTTSESLGTQVIEGISAQGTRVTETIAAGKIGNARPITITSERWYSPQLQTYILTKRSDPRFGDTVYKLTNISTAEPPADLFQVPADYTVKQGMGHGGKGMFQFRTELPPPPPPQ
jgi:hypothetical protein